MSIAREWTVLRTFKPFYDILTCVRLENFQNPKTFVRSIVIVGIFVAVSLAYAMLLILALWYCYGFGLDFHIVAFSVGLFIDEIQLVLAFDSLRRHSKEIEETIDTMAEIVGKSKLSG